MNPSLIAYIVSLVFAATNGITSNFIDLTSYQVVYLRFLLVIPLMFAVFLITGRGHFTFFRYKRSLFFLILSGASLAANVLFLFEAYRQIGVGFGILSNYCGPVYMMLLSPLIFREKLTAKKMAAFVVVVIGMLLLNGQLFLEGSSMWGIFCGLMAGISLAFLNIFNKLASDIRGVENSLLLYIVTVIVIGVYIHFKSGLVFSVPASSWPPLLFLSLVSTGIGNTLYFAAGKHLTAQTFAVFGYFEPVLAVIFSAIILSERMTPLQMLGAVLILAGALSCELFAARQAHETESLQNSG